MYQCILTVAIATDVDDVHSQLVTLQSESIDRFTCVPGGGCYMYIEILMYM